MMIRFGRKTQEAVGLDIGTYSIKVVSVRKSDDQSLLTAYNIKKLSPDVKPAEIKDIVSETMEEIDLRPEEVNLGFSGPSVIVRFIDLPKMSRDQLGNALMFEAEKYIPFSVNEIVMDFAILGDSSESGKMRVLLAAAKKDLVESRVKLMEELGMSINILDIDSLAVFNAFEASRRAEEESNAFLHFGYSQTNVLVAVGSVPCFMRQIQIGGRDVIRAIAKDKGVPVDKAEDIMSGIIRAGGEEESPRTTLSTLDDIIREMQLSFGYFENRYNTKVGEVYCSGGMAFQEGILGYVSEKTGFRMKTWSPIQGMDLAEHLSREDIDRIGPLLTVSVGLALRG